MSYNVNLHQDSVNALVITCSDFRFREAIDAWINDNLGGKADLIEWPGASKEILDNPEQVIEAVQTLNRLHGEATIHILDHIDCGAYGGSEAFPDRSAEVAHHATKLTEAGQALRTEFPAFVIGGHLLGEAGEIELA